MSDVLIKGMDMPIGCGWSTENAYGFAKCPFYERCLEKGIRLTRESRPKDCPLVELKPHGRLIWEAHLASLIISNIERLDDADEYTDEEKELVRNVYKSCLYKLSVTPTILEANNGSDN